MKLQNVEPLSGYSSTEPLAFRRARSDASLVYVDDPIVRLSDLFKHPQSSKSSSSSSSSISSSSSSSAPTAETILAYRPPAEPTFSIHWLAVDGAQPSVPQNPPPSAAYELTRLVGGDGSIFGDGPMFNFPGAFSSASYSQAARSGGLLGYAATDFPVAQRSFNANYYGAHQDESVGVSSKRARLLYGPNVALLESAFLRSSSLPTTSSTTSATSSSSHPSTATHATLVATGGTASSHMPPAAPVRSAGQALAGMTKLVKGLITHTLSLEHKQYFDYVVHAITAKNPALTQAVLKSIQQDQGLHQLLPYLSQFIVTSVAKNLRDLDKLQSLLMLANTLLISPHLYVEPYLHQLMPAILTCLVGKHLCAHPMENHWTLRDDAAVLVSYVCERFGLDYPTLQPRITRTLAHALLDLSKPLTAHYGAIRGLSALGPHVTAALIIPHVRIYLAHLRSLLSSERAAIFARRDQVSSGSGSGSGSRSRSRAGMGDADVGGMGGGSSNNAEDVASSDELDGQEENDDDDDDAMDVSTSAAASSSASHRGGSSGIRRRRDGSTISSPASSTPVQNEGPSELQVVNDQRDANRVLSALIHAVGVYAQQIVRSSVLIAPIPLVSRVTTTTARTNPSSSSSSSSPSSSSSSSSSGSKPRVSEEQLASIKSQLARSKTGVSSTRARLNSLVVPSSASAAAGQEMFDEPADTYTTSASSSSSSSSKQHQQGRTTLQRMRLRCGGASRVARVTALDSLGILQGPEGVMMVSSASSSSSSGASLSPSAAGRAIEGVVVKTTTTRNFGQATETLLSVLELSDEFGCALQPYLLQPHSDALLCLGLLS